MKKIRLATVFSGIGAIEQAFKRLHIDHEIIFACDNGEIVIDYDAEKERKIVCSLNSIKEKREYVDNLYASKVRKTNFVKISYMANYSHLLKDNNFFQDIRLLDGRDFKNKVDILVGGSPCQSFSTVGFQGGLEDTRGTLFYDYANLIKDVNPKVFIYENVRGLTTHDIIQECEPLRINHTLSVFFIGLLIKNSSYRDLEIIDDNQNEIFKFSYLWFLVSLFHDMGYVQEKDWTYKFEYRKKSKDFQARMRINNF